MNAAKRMKNILLFIGCFCMGTTSFSQAQWEVNTVRNINPRYPNSQVWKTFSSSAKPLAVAVPLGMLAVSLAKENKELRHQAYEIIAGLAFTTVATEGLKIIVNRPRPYETYNDIYPDELDPGHSFPSGHVSVAFSTATSLALITKKWCVAVPAFVWASGVGYSRMYLGQHYPSDVIAGAITGAAGAYVAHWLNKKFFYGKRKA